MPKRTLTLLTAVAALSVSVLPIAPAAFAEEASPVGIGPAGTLDTERGLFAVTAWTDTAGADIVSVSAKVRSGQTVVAEVPSLTELSWPKGRFQVPESAVLKLAEDGGTVPAIGRYSIDVTATDSKGGTTTRQDAGVLDFTLRPQFTEMHPDAQTSREDRSLRMTTRLVGVQPGSGDTVPLASREVSFTRKYDNAKPERDTTLNAVTGETGEVASPEFGMENWASFEARYTEDSEVARGSAYEYERPSITPYKVELTAQADKTRALPGETVTVTGRATHEGVAVPGTSVRVSLGNDGRGTAWGETVTTDTDGRFTAKLTGTPGIRLSGWVAEAAEFYVTGHVSGPLALPAESRIDKVVSKLAADGKVTVTGTFRNTYDREDRFDYEPVQLDFSADGRTGWKKVAVTKASYYYQAMTLNTGTTTGGYYRVHHVLSDNFTESFGPVVRLSRTQTRVVSVNASPEPVAKGATVTVTGVLQQSAGGWKAYASQPVKLYFLAKGYKTWSLVASGKTDSKGRATLKGKAGKDGSWVIRYAGDTAHFNSTAVADFVDVR
ncbi:hypothetical protein [Streptomyces sp. NBC_01481]|uniref:hypothetical protein n=1 Tax=Streptomyces sp. NBC_01481 TaxID=2975869 RepID=UPI002256D9F5|nr:hypothetical protein [Streptomyces sp. NBC_01481]MCX4584486.1 hypothetical protein [Streptomyces sp. NBC_01481]